MGDYTSVMVAMLAGGIVAAWIGAASLVRIPKNRIIAIIAALLVAIAGLLVLETALVGSTHFVLPPDQYVRLPAALVAGLIVGAVSSLLGVAGGELIIPILIFIFGADIRTAGTASVLISTPIVITGIARHWLAGRFRSRSLFSNLVLPMSVGSAVGALAGGYLAVWTPTDALRIILAIILAVSALKLAWTRAA